jgi:fucose permease
MILLCAVVLTVTSPLLTEIAASFDLDMVQSGFIFTAKFLGFTVFILLGGITADKFGKKRVLSINLVMMAVSLFLFSVSPNYVLACISIFFVGGACGILESIANALVADINTVKQSFYIVLAQVFFGIGALSGPILTGVMISTNISWRSIYIFLSIVFVVAMVIFIINKLPALPKQEKMSWLSFRGLVTDRRFLLLCLSMFLYTGSEVGAWGWMSTFMREKVGFDIIKSSVAVGIFWLSMIIGRLTTAPLTLKITPRVLLMILAYAAAVITVLSGLATNEILIWILVVFLGLSYSSQWPAIVSYGSDHYKKSTGTVFALLIGCGGLGMSVVPFFMGVIGQYVNISVSIITPAVLFLGIGLIFANIDRVRIKGQ